MLYLQISFCFASSHIFSLQVKFYTKLLILFISLLTKHEKNVYLNHGFFLGKTLTNKIRPDTKLCIVDCYYSGGLIIVVVCAGCQQSGSMGSTGSTRSSSMPAISVCQPSRWELAMQQVRLRWIIQVGGEFGAAGNRLTVQ